MKDGGRHRSSPKKNPLKLLGCLGFFIVTILQLSEFRKTKLIDGLAGNAKVQMLSSFSNSTTAASTVASPQLPDTSKKPNDTVIDDERSIATGESVSKPEPTQARRPQHVVFYNIFTPLENPQISNRIVREHARQINENATNARTELFPYQQRTILYYNQIGPRKKKNLPGQCPQGMECRFLKWYESAFEEVTLTDLYNHCRENPGDMATYLHNKGSLHNHMSNQILRRISTRASLSSACLRIGLRNCNTCGLQFQLQPHYHFSTNMWTAKCEYVRQLVSPHDYPQRRLQMCLQSGNATILDADPDTSGMKVCDKAVDAHNVTGPYAQSNGLGRFAMEYWISSHPNFVPCHVYLGLFRDFTSGWDDWWKPTLLRAGVGHIGTKKHVRKAIKRHVAQTLLLYPDYEDEVRQTLCENFNRMQSPHPCAGVVPGFTSEEDT